MGPGVMWYLQRYGGDHYNGPEGTTFSWFTCFYYLTTTFSTGMCVWSYTYTMHIHYAHSTSDP